MKQTYVNPEMDIIIFNDETILTASDVVGNTPQPGEERVDGSDIFA